MSRAKVCPIGLLSLLCLLPIGCATPSAGGAAPAATSPTGTTAAGATTPASTVASGGKHAALKAMLKNSIICKLLKEILAPFSGLSGANPTGLAMPSASDLNAPGAEGTAAKIKKETIESKKRVEAVEFLGTVDCHYYPEAAVSMIASLRTDRTECVRLAAAIALGKGCCCNKKVIEALALTVSGSEIDGNPAETSRRVRAAARASLEKCLACYKEVEALDKGVQPRKPEEPTKPETGDSPQKIKQLSYYERSEERSIEVIYARARHALRTWQHESRQFETPHRTGDGLIDILFEPNDP